MNTNILICTMFICSAISGGMDKWTSMMGTDGNILFSIMFVWFLLVDIRTFARS